MLADLNLAILLAWLVAELVPHISNTLASIERRRATGREDE